MVERPEKGRMEGNDPARAWIRPEALHGLLEAQTSAGDEEPCGVLLGRVESRAVRISEAPPTPNVHPSPERGFRIAPQDILAAARGGRARGLTLVGFWHGHLEGPAMPGEADEEGLETASSLGPNARLMVVIGRGAGRAPVVRAYVRGRYGTREIPLAT